MIALVPAEGPLFEEMLQSTFRSDLGLSARAHRQMETAQSRTAWARGSRRRVALVDGSTLLATAETSDLAAIYQGEAVRVCGIALVAGDPAGRADDHQRALVDLIVDQARQDGAAMALLTAVGGASAPHPEFVPLPLVDLMLDVAKPARYGAPMTMVRGGEDRDLQAIVAMGRVRAEPFLFHLDRNVDWIQHAITTKRLRAGLGRPNERELQFFIAEEGTTAAAYVVVSVVGGHWTLEECGDRDPSGARVGALLQALLAREPTERQPIIRSWLPKGFLPPQVTVSARVEASEVLMLRDLRSTGPRLAISSDDVLWWHNDVLR